VSYCGFPALVAGSLSPFGGVPCQLNPGGCDQSETSLPIGDVGCSITVNGYDVSVVPGNAMLPGTPGTVTGLDASTDQAGSYTRVFAQLTGPHSATILTAPKYYARISG